MIEKLSSVAFMAR